MPSSNAQQRINARVEAFFAELRILIQDAVQEAAQEALGGVGSTPASRRPGRRKAGSRKAAKKARTAAGKRIRRSSADLAVTGDAILRYVKANPGCGMSDFTSALKKTAVTLRGPLNLLLESGQLRKEGQKRGTKYYAGGGSSRKAKTAKKKTSKKRAKRKSTSKKKAKTTKKAGKRKAKKKATKSRKATA